MGQSLTQWIQIHFDATNPPLTGAGASSGTFTSTNVQVPGTINVAYTTNAITVAAGSDFTLDITTPEFAMDTNTQRDYNQGPNEHNTVWAGLPTCSQINLSYPDTSYDCLAFVKFAPTQPGLRTGTMVVTTANGSVYNFQLTGKSTGSQLAIDGGAQATVTTTGLSTALGATSSIAVSPGSPGTLYIADPGQQPYRGSASHRERDHHRPQPHGCAAKHLHTGPLFKGYPTHRVSPWMPPAIYTSPTPATSVCWSTTRSPLRQPFWAITFGSRARHAMAVPHPQPST